MELTLKIFHERGNFFQSFQGTVQGSENGYFAGYIGDTIISHKFPVGLRKWGEIKDSWNYLS
jgi:hypothetical protein